MESRWGLGGEWVGGGGAGRRGVVVEIGKEGGGGGGGECRSLVGRSRV